MTANLTPQYHKAEEQYRQASTPAEEQQCLEVMLRELPKHKGTDKLQAELKHKISVARKESEAEAKAGKKAHRTRIPRQGAGRVVLLGGPNAGKSALLAALTRATPEVAPYPFTTREPLPGMMPWEDVQVQILDTPPVSAAGLDPTLLGLIRGADLVLLVVDIGNDDGLELLQEAHEPFRTGKTRLAAESYLDETDLGTSYTRTLLVANKCDMPDAAERLEMLHELYPLELPEHVVSAEQSEGLEDLKQAIFQALDVVRVYTKLPQAREADFQKPFTLRRGRTLADVAELVHKDIAENLKYARVWGEAVHPGTQMKADYILHDKDIVELHT